MDGYFTVNQFAKKVGCSPSTVRRWIKSGRINAVRKKCVYCSRVSRCSLNGNCKRVLRVVRWCGLDIGLTCRD